LGEAAFIRFFVIALPAFLFAALAPWSRCRTELC